MQESRRGDNMTFTKEFLKDVEEAYDYWVSKQEKGVPETFTVEKWVTGIVQKPVYELIGSKRVENG